MKLTGVIPPMLCPTTDDGSSIDVVRFKQLAERLITARVHGLFVGASSGEAPWLDRRDRMASVEAVVEQTAGRVPIIAGVGDCSTARSVQFAKDAETAGANYIMILAPHFFPVREGELIHYFVSVADSVAIPTLLYNFPDRCGGQTITAKIAAEVQRKSNTVGIKDTSGNLTNTRRYRTACGPDFTLLMGVDLLAYAHLMSGGDGMICTGSNVLTAEYVGLYNACRAGDTQRALRLLDVIYTLNGIMSVGTFPAAAKAAMALREFPIGPPFAPALPLNDEETDRVRAVLGQVDLQIDTLKSGSTT